MLVVLQSYRSFHWFLFMSGDKWSDGVMTMGKSGEFLLEGYVAELQTPFPFGLFSC